MHMLSKETIRAVVAEQRKELLASPFGIEREGLKGLEKLFGRTALIILGIRRCGKSTLFRQFISKKFKDDDFLYFNFDDERLAGMKTEDLNNVLECLYELFGEKRALFFDEIQNVHGWELFVNRLMRGGKRVCITGSNSSLLSKELGSRLTGRYIDFELTPFSFSEFVKSRQMEFTPAESYETANKAKLAALFSEYMENGGFPQVALRQENLKILQNIYQNILYQDIAKRHRVKDTAELAQIGLFLISNSAKPVSFRSICANFGIKSPATAGKYLSYFEDAYLLFTVGMFSYSLKTQARNPKKVYCIDTGLANQNSFSFSKDGGRRLENAVAIHLMRKYGKIYYFTTSSGKEVDFVVQERDNVTHLIQVCADPSDFATKKREEKALEEAKKELGCKNAFIVTADFESDGKIKYVPAWKWMLEK
jgi:hypothetical protein